MVNLPPDSNESRDRNRVLDFDEFVALIIAFLSIGAVLLWGLTRGGETGRSLLSGASNFLSDPIVSMDDDPDTLLGEGDPLLPARDDQPLETRAIPDTRRTEATRERAGLPRFADPAPVIISPIPVDEQTPATANTVPVPDQETSETPPPLDISDVPQDYWAYPFIRQLYEQGYLPDLPEGQFQPEKELTRAELAALLNEAFVSNDQTDTVAFTDVSADYWAAAAINNAVAAGFMRGYPEGDFRPDQIVPRHQVMVTLASGLGLTPPADPEATLSRFQGADQLPEWSRGLVAAAAENGLVVGHPDPLQLQPLQPATRSEIAAMIYQALAATGEVEPIDSPYVVSGQ